MKTEAKRLLVKAGLTAALVFSPVSAPSSSYTITQEQPGSPQQQNILDIIGQNPAICLTPFIPMLAVSLLVERNYQREKRNKKLRDQMLDQEAEQMQPVTRRDLEENLRPIHRELNEHGQAIQNLKDQLSTPQAESAPEKHGSPIKEILIVATAIAGLALLANPIIQGIDSITNTNLQPIPVLPIPKTIDTTKMPDPALLPTPIPHVETKHTVTQAEAQEAGKTIFGIIAALAGSTIALKFLFGGEKSKE